MAAQGKNNKYRNVIERDRNNMVSFRSSTEKMIRENNEKRRSHEVKVSKKQ